MATLIAEDLLLLLLDDQKGAVVVTSYTATVLGGAVLIELAMIGAVDVEEKASVWRAAKVRARPAVVPDDEILRRAAEVVARKDRSAQDLVERLGKGLKDELARPAGRSAASSSGARTGARPDRPAHALALGRPLAQGEAASGS